MAGVFFLEEGDKKKKRNLFETKQRAWASDIRSETTEGRMKRVWPNAR
jgi:hypothetical protein